MNLKVEYGFNEDMPSLIIKGADYIEAQNNPQLLSLLVGTVESFYLYVGCDIDILAEIDSVLKSWVEKSNIVIYTFEVENKYGNEFRYNKILVLKGSNIISVLHYDRIEHHYIIKPHIS